MEFRFRAERKTASNAAPRNRAMSGSASARLRARPSREFSSIFISVHHSLPARGGHFRFCLRCDAPKNVTDTCKAHRNFGLLHLTQSRGDRQDEEPVLQLRK